MKQSFIGILIVNIICLFSLGCRKTLSDFIQISLPGNVNLELVIIQSGAFQMVSPDNEIFRNASFMEYAESLREVVIPKSYMLGKYEVTQKQWMAVMNNNPSKFIGENRPVENISWTDAKTFCEKLNGIWLPCWYKNSF